MEILGRKNYEKGEYQYDEWETDIREKQRYDGQKRCKSTLNVFHSGLM